MIEFVSLTGMFKNDTLNFYNSDRGLSNACV